MTISGIRVCTACAMLQAFALVRDAAPRITCPILAVHGERDEVCQLDAVRTLLDTQVRAPLPMTARSKQCVSTHYDWLATAWWCRVAASW